ncbi:hypothetical protein [Clostridium botulinum]|uniref:hypothetical protein n=1 Tax=Clostridium botulinum TaxID=1491 RepID=UPI0004D4647D|nr:hypothetical protein [Clostridium botulinum]KEI03498.1 hypothetical protein Z952_08270 [Clostridium botulinum C/D str. BKT75002]KEI08885.1 hypothetical protein Z954_00710 [Clostridium botulinum C/D str. BKT2873]QPW59806.1 hypothetical protein IG390_08665 [Clostridium botulinum]QPW62285.1 hypothetical protein IG390_15025 [Clostridium phage CWou-2020b]
MIRFRNPISDMNVLIENFKIMYVDFSNMDYFDLDNIAEFFAREQLASSSGYIGDEALKRSYLIKDDSRKSMKMQAKSYAELFRFLGWITSGEKALNFNFTYLGVHVAVSGSGAKSLFEQCLLGVEYPNHILDVKFPDENKPFVNMLLFAEALDGKIHRDEILLGAMNLMDGYSEEERASKIAYLREIRKTKDIDVLNDEIEKLADINEMQANSVRNLTRFVISSLEFTGWFEKKKLKVYGKSSPFLILTEKGKSVVKQINNSLIIKGDSINIEDEDAKVISDIALLCMFRRANFDVDSELEKYNTTIKNICEKSDKSDILFSPYQYFSGSELKIVLPNYTLQNGSEHRTVEVDTCVNILSMKTEALVEAKKSELSKNEQMNKMLAKRISNTNSNIQKAVDIFMEDIVTMKQTDFYPLVADLLGYVFNRDAFAPSAGNNNMRYDVMIPDDNYSIPVEVKSPTEEEMLSVKAIRQATENKVLLLARKPYKTSYEVSSFACGFKLPNDRSDVYKLIEEIFETYGINVAILDMNTLIRAAFYCAQTKSYYDVSEFVGKRGVIKFENI